MKVYSNASSIVSSVVFFPFLISAAASSGIVDLTVHTGIPKMKFVHCQSSALQAKKIQSPLWKTLFTDSKTDHHSFIHPHRKSSPSVAFIVAPSCQERRSLPKYLTEGKILGRSLAFLAEDGNKVLSIVSSTRLYHSSPQRNFFGNQKKKDDDGILGSLKSVAKKFLPSSWFQSDEERRQKMELKRVQKEVKSEIQQLFKDAPLPIRMMTNMIAPIFGGLMSSLAETAASQQSMVDVVYDQAVRSIQFDSSVRQALGDTITVGRPFSQSSSSSSINGVTTSRVELAFAVSGARGEGIGRLVASGSGNQNPTIQALEVQANGRSIDVNTIASSSSQRTNPYSSGAGYNGDDNIIDAEIIEKEVEK